MLDANGKIIAVEICVLSFTCFALPIQKQNFMQAVRYVSAHTRTCLPTHSDTLTKAAGNMHCRRYWIYSQCNFCKTKGTHNKMSKAVGKWSLTSLMIASQVIDKENSKYLTLGIDRTIKNTSAFDRWSSILSTSTAVVHSFFRYRCFSFFLLVTHILKKPVPL